MFELIAREKYRSQPNNIIDLENPEAYTCVIEQFKSGHPTMVLSIYGEQSLPGEADLSLMFTGVSYYEGPMQWIGANFCVAPQDEWLKWMHKMGWVEDAPQDAMRFLRDQLCLFTVESLSPRCKIKIVASNVHRSGSAAD